MEDSFRQFTIDMSIRMKTIVSRYLKDPNTIDAEALAKELNDAVHTIHIEYGIPLPSTYRELTPLEVMNVIQLMVSAGEFNDVLDDIRTEFDKAGDTVANYLKTFSEPNASHLDNMAAPIDELEFVYVDFYNSMSPSTYADDPLNEIIFYTFKFPDLLSAQTFVNYNADTLDGMFIRYYNLRIESKKKIIFP